MQYSSTAVQPVQQQYSRFAVLVQQYSQYSCTRIGQRRLYFSTAVQQYSSSTAVQQTAGAQVATTSPRRPRRVIAKPEEVFMGTPLSCITRVIMGHDPVAIASTAGGVIGLYVAKTVHRGSL